MSGSSMGWSVANALARRFGSITIIEEAPETKVGIVRRRARLLGWVTALGQLAFAVTSRLLHRTRERQDEICRALGFDTRATPGIRRHVVASVNSPAARALLAELRPAVVAVYGTRIIGRRTLAATSAPFINYHAGINPKYRGQHPAYWARVNGDAANAGVTIHLVDEGVDTGDVLYQAPVTFAPTDTIATYQWVQMGVALPLFCRAIEDALWGRLAPVRVDLPSHQYFPPTLWTYLWNGLTRRVW
jgi:methionyl-tRNA formyltransferase